MDRVLRNELVLENVARKLPTRDILSIRRTSRIWNHAFVAVLRAREAPAVTLYLSATHIASGNATRSGRAVKILKDYTTLMKSSLAIPYGSYSLKFQGTKTGASQLEELHDFLSVCGTRGSGCGHSIRRLEICFLGRYGGAGALNVGDILQPIFESVPGLEFLRVWASRGSNSEVMELQIPATKIIPLLQALKLGPHHILPPDARISHRGKDLRLIVPLEKKTDSVPDIENLKSIGALAHLKSISLAFATTTMLRTLIAAASMKENPLRLSSLVTSVKQFDPDPDSDHVDPLHELLRAFLSTQSHTLYQLELKVSRILSLRDANANRMSRDSPLRISNLPQLREFSLALIGAHCPIQFDGGTLQAAFPVLTSFKLTIALSRDNEVWQDNRFPHEYEPLSHTGVTSLTLRLVQNDHLAHFGNWFPAVTCLDIKLGERDLEHFSFLWTTWPGLESLCVALPRYFMQGEVWDLDQLLTGISKAEVEAAHVYIDKIVQTDGEEGAITVDKLRVIQSRYKTLAGLSDLGQLKKFVLRRTDTKTTSSITLSDVGGYVGLALASHTLQHIEVDELSRDQEDQYSCGTLTPACLQAIRSTMSRPSYAVLNICGIAI